MTNDLKNFLEEEITDLGIDFGHSNKCDLQPPNDGEQMCSCGYEQIESRVKSMNTRLINFVLDLVEKEVGLNEHFVIVDGKNEVGITTRKVSTIINNLRA